MKTKTAKTTTTTPEPELGNAQGITTNDSTEVITPTEEARQEQMATDLAKLKAGDKKRKASVKATKKAAAPATKKAAAPAAKKAVAKPAPKKAAKPAKAAANATKAAKPAMAAKPAKAAKAAKPAKAEGSGTSKKDQVLAMIGRKNGATLDEIMAATDWQKHTVRGFIAILGKKGTKIESFKNDAGARTYKTA